MGNFEFFFGMVKPEFFFESVGTVDHHCTKDRVFITMLYCFRVFSYLNCIKSGVLNGANEKELLELAFI